MLIYVQKHIYRYIQLCNSSLKMSVGPFAILIFSYHGEEPYTKTVMVSSTEVDILEFLINKIRDYLEKVLPLIRKERTDMLKKKRKSLSKKQVETQIQPIDIVFLSRLFFS